MDERSNMQETVRVAEEDSVRVSRFDPRSNPGARQQKRQPALGCKGGLALSAGATKTGLRVPASTTCSAILDQQAQNPIGGLIGQRVLGKALSQGCHDKSSNRSRCDRQAEGLRRSRCLGLGSSGELFDGLSHGRRNSRRPGNGGARLVGGGPRGGSGSGRSSGLCRCSHGSNSGGCCRCCRCGLHFGLRIPRVFAGRHVERFLRSRGFRVSGFDGGYHLVGNLRVGRAQPAGLKTDRGLDGTCKIRPELFTP